MNFKQLKEHRIVKITTNKYVLILTAFIVWMLFFDENSYLVHREFNKEVDELEDAINFYKSKIKEDQLIIRDLQDSLQLEKFAREQYLMKKKNEDIFIIEFDTLEK
ncbi:FtsB family cell division protein [Winogradskyella sp.]|uniref:FtsB family cell division protein n=1 Tax=Winogradskyella sp. TaxID=1883156 RepID=UPI003AB57983